jgi:hypothetical protein
MAYAVLLLRCSHSSPILACVTLCGSAVQLIGFYYHLKTPGSTPFATLRAFWFIDGCWTVGTIDVITVSGHHGSTGGPRFI